MTLNTKKGLYNPAHELEKFADMLNVPLMDSVYVERLMRNIKHDVEYLQKTAEHSLLASHKVIRKKKS